MRKRYYHSDLDAVKKLSTLEGTKRSVV